MKYYISVKHSYYYGGRLCESNYYINYLYIGDDQNNTPVHTPCIVDHYYEATVFDAKEHAELRIKQLNDQKNSMTKYFVLSEDEVKVIDIIK